MRNEAVIGAGTLIQIDDQSIRMERIADKLRVVVAEVFEYLSETPDDWLKFYKDSNELRVDIALDYIMEMSKEVQQLQQTIKGIRMEKAEDESA